MLDDFHRQNFEQSLQELTVFYQNLSKTIESKKTLKPGHPMTILLKKIQVFHFSDSLENMNKIMGVFGDSDFMDILGVLRSSGLVHEYVRKCEKLEGLANEKGRKIMEKQQTIKDAELEKKELGKQRRKTMTSLSGMRALIQKELEANFKARFLVVN